MSEKHFLFLFVKKFRFQFWLPKELSQDEGIL